MSGAFDRKDANRSRPSQRLPIPMAFHNNDDDMLTAADQGFTQFKMMESNADGLTTARTLAELRITEISHEE